MADNIFDGAGGLRGLSGRRQFHDRALEIDRRLSVHPRAIDPGTGAADLEWVEASGKSGAYPNTYNRYPAEKCGDTTSR
jgi:hypothetical protein